MVAVDEGMSILYYVHDVCDYTVSGALQQVTV